MKLLSKYVFSFLLISYLLQEQMVQLEENADIDGNPLPGANIYVPDVGIGAAAGSDGGYIILNIPVGDYDVVVQMMGYQKQTMTDVSVMMDQTVWLNFKLPIAAVEGEGAGLGQALVEKGSVKRITVDKEAIQSLPIRDLSDIHFTIRL